MASRLNDITSSTLENVSQHSHSTKTALLSIKNEVHLFFFFALARGEASVVFLLDQSAAFDTTDHSMLIKCLSSWFGVRGLVLDWFRDLKRLRGYLTHEAALLAADTL